MLKAKLILAHLISILPLNAVRVFAYRSFFGYRIHRARIGWRCVIQVSQAEFVGCAVAHHNRFVGPMTVRVGRGARILAHNTFVCGWWALDDPGGRAGYTRRLEIGEDTLISSRHYFDVVGTIALGDGSVIGGIGSQFWSHGPRVKERDIHIGKHCYVGSAAIFGPGAGLADHTMVALGSLVARRYHRRNVVIGGVPAETLREDFDWETPQVEDETWGPRAE
jgi:acetyltransferase-like isoleucine patch superfamily enzyme